jgi:hypothetical protein
MIIEKINEREIILFDLEYKRERPNESSWIRKYNIRVDKISEI